MAKKNKPTLIEIIIDALEDIKAKDIKVINVANITSVSDYVAIASADSNRQTRALAGNVIDKVREAGYTVYGSEGEESGEWVLVDCGDAVVHIMQPAIRDYYKLEELWLDGTLEFPKPKRQVLEKAEAAKAPSGAKPRKVADKTKPVAKKAAVKKAMTGVEKVAEKRQSAKSLVAAKVPVAKPAARKVVAKKPASVAAKVTAVKKVATKVPTAKTPLVKAAKKKNV
ncbi:MAG: ribosome silencing factor [Rhodocyclaceae bacterium]|nr:ribosome silencing factor [Rhodocyclaceae bacterium]